MNTCRLTIAMATCLGIPMTPTFVIAGDLDPPPGPVAPTMKPLTEVEPRTAIQSLPGSETALYVLSQSGSYYLTGNIIGVSAKNGIEIHADNVTIDLNGFSLVGVPDSLTAIHVPAARARIIVRNGIISSWDSNAIDGTFVTRGHAQHLITDNNGGVHWGNHSLVDTCTIRSIGGAVAIGDHSIVRGCNITSVGGIGVHAYNGFALIEQCHISDCGNDAIRCKSYSTVRGCMLDGNARHGITMEWKCVITNNRCHNNGQVHTGYGLWVTAPGNRVDGNTCTDQDIGIKAAGGNVIINNTASGNTTNYDISGSGVVSTDLAAAGAFDNIEF